MGARARILRPGNQASGAWDCRVCRCVALDDEGWPEMMQGKPVLRRPGERIVCDRCPGNERTKFTERNAAVFRRYRLHRERLLPDPPPPESEEADLFLLLARVEAEAREALAAQKMTRLLTGD